MKYAFFDLDGTIISTKSLLAFYEYYLIACSPQEGAQKWKVIENEIEHRIHQGWTRDKLNCWFYEMYFSGLNIARIQSVAENWLELQYKSEYFFVEKILARINEHKSKGEVCVLITGSFREVAEPIAKRLGFGGCLCAPLEEIDGVYTGKLLRLPTIGLGKKLAVEDFCEKNMGVLDESFGYGDDISDLNFLENLGNPNVVPGNCALLANIAEERCWSII